MDLTDFAAAVSVGNLMTLSIVWGFSKIKTGDEEVFWLPWAAIALPLFFIVSSLILTVGLPPSLDALAAQ